MQIIRYRGRETKFAFTYSKKTYLPGIYVICGLPTKLLFPKHQIYISEPKEEEKNKPEQKS